MQIPLRINFHGMPKSQPLERWVAAWMHKLESVCPHLIRCEVAIEAPHHSQRNGLPVHVRIDISVPDGEIVVSRDPGPREAHEDAFVAVRDAFRAARRQLEDRARRVRGDVKSHVRPRHGVLNFLDAERPWGRTGTTP
jgi:hypothetical protein